MNPTITVHADLTNPGHVFGCCGLLELAHRLTPCGGRAIGWFEDLQANQAQFHIHASDRNSQAIRLTTIFDHLRNCRISPLEFNDKEGPVHIGEPFDIIIDWRRAYPQNISVKTWAGKQEIHRILKELFRLIPPEKEIGEFIFDYNCNTELSVTSFHISKSENKLDVGFSIDNLNKKRKLYFLTTYILTELLALIGLQRFCPLTSEGSYRRTYYVWKEPLNAENATIAIWNRTFGITSKGFTFDLYRRDSGGRYKSFSTAKQIT